jgi:hypothetical protein
VLQISLHSRNGSIIAKMRLDRMKKGGHFGGCTWSFKYVMGKKIPQSYVLFNNRGENNCVQAMEGGATPFFCDHCYELHIRRGRR